MKIKMMILFCGLAFLALSCSSGTESGENGFKVEKKNGKIILVDQTNKSWDITHAVEEYGFVPERFQFGLGPNAILPINSPEFLQAGEPGYPDNNSDFLVLAASLFGSPKAFPISVMSRHEIANDQFGSAHVAVAY